MNIDILTPEFMELADKAKVIFAKKDKKIQEFKVLWERHKQEIAALAAEAEELKQKYLSVAEAVAASVKTD